MGGPLECCLEISGIGQRTQPSSLLKKPAGNLLEDPNTPGPGDAVRCLDAVFKEILNDEDVMTD